MAAQEAKNPAARRSDRHPGLAGDLHRALCADVGRADRHRRLAHAGRCPIPCPSRSASNPGAALAGAFRSTSPPSPAWPRWSSCSLYGQSRIFYAHGARRLPAARLRRRASALPHAASRHHHHRRRRARCSRPCSRSTSWPIWFRSARCSPSSSVCVGHHDPARHARPSATRKFRTPLVWFVAPAGIVICGVMMFCLSNGHLGAAGGLDRRSVLSSTSATASGTPRRRSGPSPTKAELHELPLPA